MPTDVIFFSSMGQIKEYLGSFPEKNIANQKLSIYMSTDFALESSGFDPVEREITICRLSFTHTL